MSSWIEELNEEWNTLEQQMKFTEETVKNYFVIPFLQNIGYDKKTCLYHYEYNCRVGIVDVYIELKERSEGIYIETKRGDVNIGREQIEQIANYLFISNIKWGILTNGKEYYLINKDIVSEKNNDKGDALLDKVVLVCDLKVRTDYIKYFSKEYIFENKKTLFMRDIAQFKAYKNYKNWDVYFSTLFGFFNYYCEKIEPDLVIQSVYTSNYLSDIREKDFKEYLLTLKPKVKGKEKLSTNIVKAKCSHISAMYREFEKRNIITINNFRDVRANIIKQFTDDGIVSDNDEAENYLTRENIVTIIGNFLKESKKDEVNVRFIVFGLIVYYGFTKSEVVEFLLQPWNCIKFDKKRIEYRGVQRNLPKLLEDNFNKLKKVTGKKKNILNRKGERGQTISLDIVTATFDEIKRMDGVEGKEKFTPEYTRKMLVKKLFDAGFSLEEISGYIGISLGSLEKIIGKEKIAKIGLKRWNMKKRPIALHPFEEEFDKFEYINK